MDLHQKITYLLLATIDPAQREVAKGQLKQLETIISTAPTLLKIIMTQSTDLPIRQAGAIYLKNMMFKSWSEDEDDPSRFHIHEQDRSAIRDSLIDACVPAPPVIRSQLCDCIGYVCKQDFSGGWSSLVDKIVVYLQSPEQAGWPDNI